MTIYDLLLTRQTRPSRVQQVNDYIHILVVILVTAILLMLNYDVGYRLTILGSSHPHSASNVARSLITTERNIEPPLLCAV